MTIFITGGCKNGKSTFAVQRAMELGEKRFYVATMIPRDTEDRKRVRYHRAKRAGLGFATVESPELTGFGVEKDGVYLVDSVTALVQNAMFGENGKTNPSAARAVIQRLGALMERAGSVIFVSDYLYSNAKRPQGLTEDFARELSAVERFLVRHCDKTWEICATTALEWSKAPENPGQEGAKWGQSVAKPAQSVDKVVEGVEFVLGGAHQGKLDYVQKTYGLTREQVFFCDEGGDIDRTKPCVYGVERYILGCLRREIPPNLDFSAQKAVVMTDIFCGLVSTDAEERLWRERCGHAAAELARQAGRVTRLFCGLSQRLK